MQMYMDFPSWISPFVVPFLPVRWYALMYHDVMMIPQNLQWKTPTKHGWISRTVKVDKKGYDMHYKADMDPEIIPAVYYQELMDMARTLRHPSFTTLLLKKEAEPVKKEAEMPKKEPEQPKKEAAPEKKAA